MTPSSPSADLDDRLAELLARSADAVEVSPDLDAVIAPGAVVVDLHDRPDRTRRRLGLAGIAAALLVVAVGAVLVARDDAPVGVVASPPGIGDAYPVLGYAPGAIAGDLHALRLGQRIMAEEHDDTTTWDPRRGRAVIGQRAADGSLASVATVLLGPPGFAGVTAGRGETTHVAGIPATIASGGGQTSAVVSGEAVAVVSGPGDVEGLLAEVPDGDLVLGWEGDLPTIQITGGPTEVLVPSAPLPTTEQAVTHSGEAYWSMADGAIPDGLHPGTPRASVRTRTDDPVAELAWAGGMEPVDVGGVHGWHVPAVDGGVVAWTAPNGTNVVVEVQGLAPDDDLAVARGLRLVDEATWRRTYDEPLAADPASRETTTTTDGDDPPSTTGATDPRPDDAATARRIDDHPLVGQAMPEAAGLDAHDDLTRAWTYVAVMASWCVPCRTAVAESGAFVEAHLATADLRSIIVGLDDTDAAMRSFIETNGGHPHDPVLATEADAEAWGVESVPTTFLVGPDGTVGAVFEGPVTVAALEATLAELKEVAGNPELTWIEDGYCTYPDRGTGETSCDPGG